jgi:hypothetical protein
MSAIDERLEWTQAEFIEEAKRRFGDDPLRWAFACPHCGDVATPQDFKDAGADPNRIGKECIGRSLGALAGGPTADGGRSKASRGCDWCAYGLFGGPWTVITPEGKKIHSFRFAPAGSP